jgi:hypothetical protein
VKDSPQGNKAHTKGTKMSWLSLVQRYLLGLSGTVPEDAMHYLHRERARKKLQEITGQDFGYDVKQWEDWLEQHPEILAKWHFGPTLTKNFTPGGQ